MSAFKNIQLCVFDMAGTTVSEDNLVYKTVQSALDSVGVEVSLALCLEHGAGKEKRQAIIDIIQAAGLEDAQNQLADAAFSAFKNQLDAAYNAQSVQSFAGMVNFFAWLKSRGIKVVLNTGYARATAEKILNILNWHIGTEIDGLITADDVTNGRPAPDMIQLAMAAHNISDSQQVLKAGDSAIDVLEGKNARCGVVVGCLSGAQPRAQLEAAKADVIVAHLTDLKQYFEV